MPKFIDYHEKLPPMPTEAVNAMSRRVKARKPDEFGVKPLNVFFGKKGQAYCLTEAPDANAVVRAHKAQGVQLRRSDVVEVRSLI